MIEEFQKVLETPKPSNDNYFRMIQDAMLNTMESIMPQDFDFGELAKLFEKESQCDNLASLTLKLTEYFVRVVGENFISLQSYYGLEHQTQKLESTVRGHIKMEQEMKMYLEHLQYKIDRYEYHLSKLKKHPNHNTQSEQQLKQFREKQTIDQLKKKQTQLLKQRIVLLRKVDHLQRKLKDHQNQLKRLNSPSSATIQQIKEEILRQRTNSQERIIETSQICVSSQINKLNNENERRTSMHSFTNDHQVTQKKSSNTLNVAQAYRMYSNNGREQGQSNNPIPAQLVQTIKQIQFVQSKNIIVVQNLNSPIQNLAEIK